MIPLESAVLFRQLKPAEVAFVCRLAEERTFASGQQVFCEGDPGDGLYVVKSGLVEISGQLGNEFREAFLQVPPGGAFGEMAVIEKLPRSANATAAQPTTVYFLPRAPMVELIERTPALALALMRLVSHRLRDFNRHHLHEVVQAERLAIVGRFARSIVHDLKNPLNIIGLSMDMLGRPDAPVTARTAAAARVNKQLERINDLIGDILQFAHDKQILNRAPVSYAALVEQVLAELRPELEITATALTLATPLPDITVNVDAKRLRRVFVNIIHNATDAMMGEGSITLRFSCDGREVRTEIADTGPGIPVEIADKLFQPFASYGKAHGSGLGLNICKRIIEDHGGRISAQNDPKGGAVFSFALPVA